MVFNINRGAMKMKIPLTPVGNNNGYYNNGLEFGGFDGDHHPNSVSQDELNSPRLDEDFSEYLWMENEEEFDKQVMQQLEEEALMEQCIEAMLEDEREALTTAANVRAPWSNGVDATELCDEMSGLRMVLAPEDIANSTLNPLAAEFVPAPMRSHQSATPTTPPIVTANS